MSRVAFLLLFALLVDCICGDVAGQVYGQRVNSDIMRQRFADRDQRWNKLYGDLPFMCYYSPFDVHADGDFVGHEVAQIQRVIDARRAIPRGTTFADNPFRIQYAVFNLRNPRVIDKLAEAHQAGVIVQVLMPSEKIDINKSPWQTWLPIFENAGIPKYSDRKRDFLTASVEKRTQQSALVGVWLPGFGSFHTKIRTFQWLENGIVQRAAMTGSQNPTDESPASDEVICRINDQTLIQKYFTFYETLRDGREDGFQNVWDPNMKVNAMLDPGVSSDMADKIIEWIDAENELIFFSIFSVESFDGLKKQGYTIFDAIVAAEKRGAYVVFVCDIKFCGNDPLMNKLRAANMKNFHLYQLFNPAGPWNAIHFKEIVLGVNPTRLITDTTNWSLQALGGLYTLQNKPGFPIVKKTKYVKPKSVESMLFIDAGRDTRIPQRALRRHFLTIEKYWYQTLPNPANNTFNGLHPRDLFKKLSDRFGDRLTFQRTSIFVQKSTSPGQFVGLRGALCDSTSGQCTEEPQFEYGNYWNGDTLDLKVSQRHLSWESSAALDWTCNKIAWQQRSDKATYAEKGYGYDPILDTLTTPSDPSDSYWQFSAYIQGKPKQYLAYKLVLTDGPGGRALLWEADGNGQSADVPAALRSNNNHLIRLGETSVVSFREQNARLRPRVIGQ